MSVTAQKNVLKSKLRSLSAIKKHILETKIVKYFDKEKESQRFYVFEQKDIATNNSMDYLLYLIIFYSF